MAGHNKKGGPMGGGPGMPVEKAKNFKGTMKNLIKYMGRYKIAIAIVMVCAGISAVFSVIGPKIM